MIDANGEVTGIINGSITEAKLDANLQEKINSTGSGDRLTESIK